MADNVLTLDQFMRWTKKWFVLEPGQWKIYICASKKNLLGLLKGNKMGITNADIETLKNESFDWVYNYAKQELSSKFYFLNYEGFPLVKYNIPPNEYCNYYVMGYFAKDCYLIVTDEIKAATDME